MFILIFLAVIGFFIVIGCFAILVVISLVCYMIRICRGDEGTDSDTGSPPHGHKSCYNSSKTVLVEQYQLPRTAISAKPKFKTNLTVPRCTSYNFQATPIFIPYMGSYTNHTDRIWGNFDPPPSYVQTLYQPTKFHQMAKKHGRRSCYSAGV